MNDGNAHSDHSNSSARWSVRARNGDFLPTDVARFRANLVMLDLPEPEIDEAIDTVQEDYRRWEGIGSPPFRALSHIVGFHALLVKGDDDFELIASCLEARQRLARKINFRRRWAELASRSADNESFSQAFKHYDDCLDAPWPAVDTVAFRNFIEEASLAFEKLVSEGLISRARDGREISAYKIDKRRHLNYCSSAAIDNSLSILRNTLLLACQEEASIYNVEMEAVYFSVNNGDASSLHLLVFFSDLWWSRGRPRLKFSDDVEAFIAFGLLKRWKVRVHDGEPVPEVIERHSRTIRRFCEALMVRRILPITGFARELAKYHPLFEEEDYYGDARGYYEYLLKASSRFPDGVSDDDDVSF
jgi:hypothetical protein